MMSFTIPPTRKKPTDIKDNYETNDYSITGGITHEDDKANIEEYKHKGPTIHVVCQTEIDLAGQLETRQSTSSLMIRIRGAVVHWRAHTERIVIQSTAAGEYIALSRGNTTAKFVRDILVSIHRQSSCRTHRHPTKHERTLTIHRYPPPCKPSRLHRWGNEDRGSRHTR
jgi:hypothetical protein